MMLEVRDYLKAHGRASLADLANRFGSEPDALRGLLGKWVAKGRVRRLAGDGSCSSACCRCEPDRVEIYEWTW
jgi:hypothetical protein